MKTIKSIEENLIKLLDKNKLSNKISVEKIKDWIYNSKGDSVKIAYHEYQEKWINHFAKIKDFDELNRILQIFNDAWNNFPHKTLGDKSPEQLIQEEIKKNPDIKNKGKQKKPDFIVGGHKMSWDRYWAMIKEMERLQTPFKNWIDKKVIPSYKLYLIDNYSPKIYEKHIRIAELFFDRVLHVGFIELNQIRRDFIQKEFSKWWQTHVIANNLREKEIISSLEVLFRFISSTYHIDIKKFGF